MRAVLLHDKTQALERRTSERNRKGSAIASDAPVVKSEHATLPKKATAGSGFEKDDGAIEMFSLPLMPVPNNVGNLEVSFSLRTKWLEAFSRASAKRRRALLESNSPSNSRGVRLQTAARGDVITDASPLHPMPVVRILWLENFRSRAPRGEDSGIRPTRDVSGRSLQARLIACNLRHHDALATTSASWSGGFVR